MLSPIVNTRTWNIEAIEELIENAGDHLDRRWQALRAAITSTHPKPSHQDIRFLPHEKQKLRQAKSSSR
jgi:hypothetical protein